jgi:putative hemolysin
MKSKFNISAFPSKGILRAALIILGPVIDRVLGFRKMERLYNKAGLEGLSKELFVKKALEALNLTYSLNEEALSSIPKKGRFIIICNHPYGGIEGIILADMLNKIRGDIKFMANSGLRLIREMDDFFIYTNPLVTHNYRNVSSIRACQQHLEKDGLLVLFPAGRVSFYHKDKERITDGEWNRIPARMNLNTKASIMPIFISGTNSPLFQMMGRIFYRFRLLMLPRELMKMKNRRVDLYGGRVLEHHQLKGDSREITDFLRMQTYLQDPDYIFNRIAEPEASDLPDIIPAVPASLIKEELAGLPEKQHLLDFKNYSVFYGYYEQLENTVREITRLREVTFREMKEGSGAERDTDRYDTTYTQLFIFDNSSEEIIGAYRIGQIDKLISKGDAREIYLSKMFNFEGEFFSKIKIGVEMGRSFLIKREQKSMYGFFLLWRGIGEFFVRNPKYRYAYGTVSLSNMYDPRSIAMMHRVLVGRKNLVQPVTDINILLHPDVEEYMDRYKPGLKELSRIISIMETDGKGLPVLVRQYEKMGAKFVS